MNGTITLRVHLWLLLVAVVGLGSAHALTASELLTETYESGEHDLGAPPGGGGGSWCDDGCIAAYGLTKPKDSDPNIECTYSYCSSRWQGGGVVVTCWYACPES